jgi:biotin carboxylase
VVVPLDPPEAGADAIEALHRRAPIDAVVGVDDRAVMVAAMAAERLGLRHAPVEAVAATRDKGVMRTALARAGVPQPAFAVAGPRDDLSALGFPVVIKPLSRSGSQGVIRADDPDAARDAAARVREILGDASAPLLIEAFVPGVEIAVEGIVRAGNLNVLAVFDKPDPLDGPYFEETIYVTPSRLDDAVLARVRATTAATVAALGITEGPVHAELRVPPSGDPVVIEMAARSIGGLCSRSLRFGLGVSLEQLVVRAALGLPAHDLRPQWPAAGVMMLPIPRSGTLVAVRGQDEARAVPGIAGLELSIVPGRPVVALPEGDRYLGFLFARGKDPERVEAALRTASAHLSVVIE